MSGILCAYIRTYTCGACVSVCVQAHVCGWKAQGREHDGALYILPLIIHHEGFLHSVSKNSLSYLHRRRSLAILGRAGPCWRMRLLLHFVLGLPCRLVHSRGAHSVTLLINLLSLNRTMCPAHPCIPFLVTFTLYKIICRSIAFVNDSLFSTNNISYNISSSFASQCAMKMLP